MQSKLKDARSFCSGIIFYSSSAPEYTTMVTIDKSGNIKTEWLHKKEAEKYINKRGEDQKENNVKTKSTTMSAIIFTICMLIFVLPWILYDLPIAISFINIQKRILLFIRELFNIRFLIIVSLFILIISILYFLVDIYVDINTRRFHAAEHMIISAYIRLNKIPSFEEVSHYSRFSTNCGSNTVVLLMIFCIVCLLFLLFNMNIYICFTILLVSIFFRMYGLLNFVQFITTKPPTERELRVAIIGLNAWLENEQKIEENNFSDCW